MPDDNVWKMHISAQIKSKFRPENNDIYDIISCNQLSSAEQAGMEAWTT